MRPPVTRVRALDLVHYRSHNRSRVNQNLCKESIHANVYIQCFGGSIQKYDHKSPIYIFKRSRFDILCISRCFNANRTWLDEMAKMSGCMKDLDPTALSAYNTEKASGGRTDYQLIKGEEVLGCSLLQNSAQHKLALEIQH